MPQTTRRPTLQQVALHAGVSRSTAGAALAGSSRVAPATVERVRTAAMALGYRTEPHARLLRRGGPELANIVLDTRLTHSVRGAMHPFWSALLTGLLIRMQQLDWLCTVQLQSADAPVLPAAAPGVLLATNDTGRVALFMGDAFGQTVVTPVPATVHDGPRAILQHDYAAIGRACARHFADRGCRNVLLMGRSGFSYSEAIVESCAETSRDAGVTIRIATGQGGAAQRLQQGLTADTDGLLDLTAERSQVVSGLHGRRVVTANPDAGDIVVVTNADGADRHDTSGMARLSLEGRQSGSRVADYFVATMNGPGHATAPILPFRIYPAAMGSALLPGGC